MWSQPPGPGNVERERVLGNAGIAFFSAGVQDSGAYEKCDFRHCWRHFVAQFHTKIGQHR